MLCPFPEKGQSSPNSPLPLLFQTLKKFSSSKPNGGLARSQKKRLLHRNAQGAAAFAASLMRLSDHCKFRLFAFPSPLMVIASTASNRAYLHTLDYRRLMLIFVHIDSSCLNSSKRRSRCNVKETYQSLSQVIRRVEPSTLHSFMERKQNSRRTVTCGKNPVEMSVDHNKNTFSL